MERRFLLFLMVLMLLYKHDFAQQTNAEWMRNTDSTNIVFTFPNKSAFSIRDTVVLDTALYYFQRYNAKSYAYDMSASTMNIGGPLKDLYFGTRNSQFSIGEDALGKYYLKSEEMPHYAHVKVPYSEIFYTMGSSEENYLRGELAAQASKRLYYGIRFSSQSSMGFMTNSQVRNANFDGLVAFETFNKRYDYEVEYVYNKFKFGENGGLSDDTYYDSTQFDRQVLAVSLNEASNSIKSHKVFFKQHLNIGKTSTDSTKNRFIGQLYLNSFFKTTTREYFDKSWDSSYYQNAYFDAIKSHDSITMQDIGTDFGFTNFYPNKHQYFIFNFGAEYSNKKYFDGFNSYYFNYISPHADAIFDFYKVILEGGFKYQIKMDKPQTLSIGANDLNFYTTAKFPLIKYFILDASFKMDLNSPEISATKIYTNHFIWDNTFEKQKHIELNSHLKYKGYKLEVAVHNTTDYLYFDSLVQPKQYADNIQVLTAKFKKRFALKNVGTAVMLMYQKSSNEEIIRLPEFVGRASFFFSFPMFKGALDIHPGIDLTYISSYYADNYNPSVMQFHNQNEVLADGQLYADFFINFKIKRVRVFLNYMNAGSHLGAYHYFLVSHYPQKDATLRIGFSWRFFD